MNLTFSAAQSSFQAMCCYVISRLFKRPVNYRNSLICSYCVWKFSTLWCLCYPTSSQVQSFWPVVCLEHPNECRHLFSVWYSKKCCKHTLVNGWELSHTFIRVMGVFAEIIGVQEICCHRLAVYKVMVLLYDLIRLLIWPGIDRLGLCFNPLVLDIIMGWLWLVLALKIGQLGFHQKSYCFQKY